MCTDPKRSAHRARHRFFGLIRHRVYGRDYEARLAVGPEDKRPRLLARAAEQDIVDETSVSLAPEPAAPFFHQEDYDPETHLALRNQNRVENYLEERAEEELREMTGELIAA